MLKLKSGRQKAV